MFKMKSQAARATYESCFLLCPEPALPAFNVWNHPDLADFSQYSRDPFQKRKKKGKENKTKKPKQKNQNKAKKNPKPRKPAVSLSLKFQVKAILQIYYSQVHGFWIANCPTYYYAGSLATTHRAQLPWNSGMGQLTHTTQKEIAPLK